MHWLILSHLRTPRFSRCKIKSCRWWFLNVCPHCTNVSLNYLSGIRRRCPRLQICYRTVIVECFLGHCSVSWVFLQYRLMRLMDFYYKFDHLWSTWEIFILSAVMNTAMTLFFSYWNLLLLNVVYCLLIMVMWLCCQLSKKVVAKSGWDSHIFFKVKFYEISSFQKSFSMRSVLTDNTDHSQW